MSESANPFAPPQAEVADIATGTLELAGRGQRLLAVLVDLVVALVVFWVAAKLLPIDPFDPDPSFGALALNMVSGLALFLLVQGWPLVKRGQTLGKMLLSIRIVRPDGSLASPGRVLGLRYGVGWVIASVPFVGGLFALVDSLLIFRDSRKCLHDNIADTIVVRG